MCRLILFGRIQEQNPDEWKGMRLHSRQGDIRPRNYRIPSDIADYMNRKAERRMKKKEAGSR
jgi:hypothetical protein